MFKILFCFLLVLTVCGCSTDISTNNKQRIVGIIDSCKANKQGMNEYLKSKVNNKQISEIVSFTIQECLK